MGALKFLTAYNKNKNDKILQNKSCNTTLMLKYNFMQKLRKQKFKRMKDDEENVGNRDTKWLIAI